MKKKFTKLGICTLLLLSLFLVSGCGDDQKDEAPIVNPVEITITIDYPEKAEPKDVVEEPFKVEAGSTVLDAIQIYCNVKEIPLTVETTDGSVVGINSVDNLVFYKKGTWEYKIDDKISKSPANTQVLTDGNNLKWIYKK